MFVSFRRFFAFACVSLFAFGLAPARADEPPIPQSPVVAEASRPVPAARMSRPAGLPVLYVSFATLQALDVHSTLKALDGGGAREANPLLGTAVRSPAVMIALKAGAGTGMIYASERLWKRNRIAAVVFMCAIDSAYAIVVAHNYSVAARAR